jgi:hypothetical protein
MMTQRLRLRCCLVNVLALGGIVLALSGCAAPLTEFYPDSYFTEDGVYDNKILGFALTFPRTWRLVTDPNAFNQSQKKLARILNRQGVDMLFLGSTSDGMQGARALAANLNLTTKEYFQRTWNANHVETSDDKGVSEMVIADIPVLRWEYSLFGLRYNEFFLTLGTCNLRIAFWATPDRFERFLPVYLEIMASISSVGWR